MGICFISVILGGLLFVYFNFVIGCKINLTLTYLTVHINIRLFKKFYTIKNKKVIYYDYINYSVKKYKSVSTKKYFPFLRKLTKFRRIFILNNISFYPECFDDFFSFAVEFTVVNKITKRPLFKYGADLFNSFSHNPLFSERN